MLPDPAPGQPFPPPWSGQEEQRVRSWADLFSRRHRFDIERMRRSLGGDLSLQQLDEEEARLRAAALAGDEEAQRQLARNLALRRQAENALYGLKTRGIARQTWFDRWLEQQRAAAAGAVVAPGHRIRMGFLRDRGQQQLKEEAWRHRLALSDLDVEAAKQKAAQDDLDLRRKLLELAIRAAQIRQAVTRGELAGLPTLLRLRMSQDLMQLADEYMARYNAMLRASLGGG